MASSLARLLAIELVGERLAASGVGEQIDELVGELYHPSEEFA